MEKSESQLLLKILNEYLEEQQRLLNSYNKIHFDSVIRDDINQTKYWSKKCNACFTRVNNVKSIINQFTK
jgi:hypothetical protein